MRAQPRALDFYISDWNGGSLGFTASDFDDVTRPGLVPIGPAAGRLPKGIATVSRRGSRKSAGAPESDLEDRLVAIAHEALSGVRCAIPVPEECMPKRRGLYALWGDATVRKGAQLSTSPKMSSVALDHGNHVALPTGHRRPKSTWIKAGRPFADPAPHGAVQRAPKSRGAVEREFGRLKHEWALPPFRSRGIERVKPRADLTILAELGCALPAYAAVPTLWSSATTVGQKVPRNPANICHSVCSGSLAIRRCVW